MFIYCKLGKREYKWERWIKILFRISGIGISYMPGVKTLLNWSNISSNITKIPCWMKCWIGLTERKNSKENKKKRKRKNHDEWRKIVLNKNLIASNFFIQHFQAYLIFILDHSSWFTPCSIHHFILMTSFRALELRISNDSTKLKRSVK